MNQSQFSDDYYCKGGEIIRSAKLEVERTGFDCDAGILSSEPPEEEETQGGSNVHDFSSKIFRRVFLPYI